MTTDRENGDVFEAARLLTIREVGKLLSVHPRTVSRLIDRGEFPRPIKVGSSSRFSRQEIDDYIDALKDRRVMA